MAIGYNVSAWMNEEIEGDSFVVGDELGSGDGTIVQPTLTIYAVPYNGDTYMVSAQNFNIGGAQPTSIVDGVYSYDVTPTEGNPINGATIQDNAPDLVASGTPGNSIKVSVTLDPTFDMPPNALTLNLDINGTAQIYTPPAPAGFRWILTNKIWPQSNVNNSVFDNSISKGSNPWQEEVPYDYGKRSQDRSDWSNKEANGRQLTTQYYSAPGHTGDPVGGGLDSYSFTNNVRILPVNPYYGGPIGVNGSSYDADNGTSWDDWDWDPDEGVGRGAVSWSHLTQASFNTQDIFTLGTHIGDIALFDGDNVVDKLVEAGWKKTKEFTPTNYVVNTDGSVSYNDEANAPESMQLRYIYSGSTTNSNLYECLVENFGVMIHGFSWRSVHPEESNGAELDWTQRKSFYHYHGSAEVTGAEDVNIDSLVLSESSLCDNYTGPPWSSYWSIGDYTGLIPQICPGCMPWLLDHGVNDIGDTALIGSWLDQYRFYSPAVFSKPTVVNDNLYGHIPSAVRNYISTNLTSTALHGGGAWSNLQTQTWGGPFHYNLDFSDVNPFSWVMDEIGDNTAFLSSSTTLADDYVGRRDILNYVSQEFETFEILVSNTSTAYENGQGGCGPGSANFAYSEFFNALTDTYYCYETITSHNRINKIDTSLDFPDYTIKTSDTVKGWGFANGRNYNSSDPENNLTAHIGMREINEGGVDANKNPVKYILIKQCEKGNNSAWDDPQQFTGNDVISNKFVEVSIVLRDDWIWDSNLFQKGNSSGSMSDTVIFISNILGDSTPVITGEQMPSAPYNISLVDSSLDNNSGNVTVVNVGGNNTVRKTNRGGFKDQEVAYCLTGTSKINEPTVVATVNFTCDSGKYFPKIPSLTNDTSNGNIKMIPKGSPTTSDNKITSQKFDLVYTNKHIERSNISRRNIKIKMPFDKANLNFKVKSTNTRRLIINNVNFGNTIVSEHGEIRDVIITGTPGTPFVVTINDSSNDSILGGNLSIIDSRGETIRATGGNIKRDGTYRFKQRFPKIPIIQNTAVNGSMAASGATKIKFDNLTGVEVGDKLIMAGIAANNTVVVTALDPDGDDVNECTLSSSVTAADNTKVSFRRAETYSFNITSTASLSSNIPTTNPTYTIGQYINPILTLTASETDGGRYSITDHNGVTVGADTTSTASYTGRPNKTSAQLSNNNNVKSTITLSYLLDYVASENFAYVKTVSPYTPVFSSVNQEKSDWSNSVAADNGGTELNLTNTTITAAGSGTITITATFDVIKWGNTSITMNLDLDKIVKSA